MNGEQVLIILKKKYGSGSIVVYRTHAMSRNRAGARWKARRPEAADMPRPNGTLIYFHGSNLPRPLSRILSAGPSAPQPPKLHPPPPIQQFRRAMPTVRIDVLGPRMIGLIWGPLLRSQSRQAYVPGRAPQLSPESFPC